MKENFVQPLAIGFQANQEMQGIKTEREIQHEAILHGYAKSLHAMRNHAKSSHAMRNLRMLCEIFACYAKFKRRAIARQIYSKEEQLQENFRAFIGVHCINTIYHFEAREVRSLTLQTVCKLELK